MTFHVKTDATDRITFEGRHYTVKSWKADKVNLQRVDMPEIVESLNSETMEAIWSRNDFRYEPRYFSGEAAPVRGVIPALKVSDLNARDKDITLNRLAYVEGWLRLLALPGKQYVRTYDSAAEGAKVLQPLVDGLGNFAVDDNHRITSSEASRPRKGRVGSPMLVDGKPQVKARNPPSGYALMDWLWKFQNSGGDPLALRPAYGQCGNYGTHLHPEVEAIITKTLPFYLSEDRPSAKIFHDEVVRRVKARNKELRDQGETKVLRLPGRGSTDRTIKNLSPYYVACKRYGESYAKKAYPWITDPIDVRLPGQRVEIDAYQCDVMTLAIWSGCWEGLTRAQRKALERKRMWLTIAIDRATRCILGMRLSDTANVPNAISAIEMVESDKTIYSQYAGTETPWHHRCGIMTAVADGGYVSSEFRAALADARATLEFPQAGDPAMRGVVERIFRTVAVQLLARLNGKTFSNIFERADYDSEGHASLTEDELAHIMVTWVVDIYHNTGHENLGGKTPNQAWEEAVEKFGLQPWRDAHGRRSAFGVRIKRKLRGNGFEVLGNYYQDDDPQGLRHLYLNSRQTEFELAVDVTNLGAISVIIDDVAIAVPCKDPKMEGVHAAEFVQTTATLRRENETRNQLPREIAHRALERIRQINDQSRMRSSIFTRAYSAEEIDHLEKEHFEAFTYFEVESEPSEILGESIAAVDLTDLLSAVEMKRDETETSDAQISNETAAPAPNSEHWTMEE